MLTLPEDFVSTLYGTFQNALHDGNLIYNGEDARFEIIERTIGDKVYKFHLTELQSLQKRPEKGKVESNPFQNPEPELTILPEYGVDKEYRVVLNKFPVVPAHFMLVSKVFKSQNDPLSPNDMVAVYSILNSLETHDSKKRWFAFFNCGQQSGASQPHKHIQFMSLPDGFEPIAEKLCDELSLPSSGETKTREPLQDPNLPYANFVAELTSNDSQSEDALAQAYVSLLQRTLTVLRDNESQQKSYNFCATSKFMMMIPRSAGKFENMFGLNSCGYMGLVLCKDASLVEMVKERGFDKILGDLGFPNSFEAEGDEYQY